ncbi:hypothetical protein PRIC2_001678 [Phytophthora ramorum]
MKLLPDAAAVLTLGPKLTKDKLMQGAGRMRQLGCDQTLWIASFDEVAQSVLQTSGKTDVGDLVAVDVLNWVMQCTTDESVRGLLEWAGNGIHFRKTQHDRGAEVVNENWSLETLYQDKLHREAIARVIESRVRFSFENVDDDVVKQIDSVSATYGLNNEVCVTSHTNECERELQTEEENVKIRACEVAQCSPAQEEAWKYSATLSVRELFLYHFGSGKHGPHDRVLAPIDVLLVFDNDEILLVSECEADHILKLVWSSSATSFRFVNLGFAWESIGRVGKHSKFRDMMHLILGSQLGRAVSLLSASACYLYNGETMVPKREQTVVEPVFRELLHPVAQREVALNDFVQSRGSNHKWTRSFLHELCYRMDLEDCE